MRNKCVRCSEQVSYSGLYCGRCKRDNDTVYTYAVLPVVDFTPSDDPTSSYDPGPSYDSTPSFDGGFDGGSSGGGGGGSDY